MFIHTNYLDWTRSQTSLNICVSKTSTHLCVSRFNKHEYVFRTSRLNYVFLKWININCCFEQLNLTMCFWNKLKKDCFMQFIKALILLHLWFKSLTMTLQHFYVLLTANFPSNRTDDKCQCAIFGLVLFRNLLRLSKSQETYILWRERVSFWCSYH